MNNYLNNLNVPKVRIDAILDTDTYNEVDDQFALCYMLASKEKINVRALYAAPFYNQKSTSPDDGMERSFKEIHKILDLTHRDDLKENTFRGSLTYLNDEKTPVVSDAAEDLAKRAMEYSPENPLYVVAIGAITNVASALLIKPEIAKNIVIVWLGGHALHYSHTREFNMMQDVAAARVVFMSGAPVVQLPCIGVVSAFTVSTVEIEYYLKGKNPVCDYLCETVKNDIINLTDYKYAEGEEKPWKKCVSRVIWDVTAVAWLLNDNDRLMESRLEHCPVPEYDDRYAVDKSRFIRYVYNIRRDALANDLFDKLTNEESFR
ncbi:MAG: nucleoside hydrolase [Clostridia bacterium]|nr:nucleoside hydrolase [Clostridia bacterium]